MIRKVTDYCNGTPEKNGDDITPWRNHGTVTNEEKFGGNLEGIRQRLSYLQELGITGIYLKRITSSRSIWNFSNWNVAFFAKRVESRSSVG